MVVEKDTRIFISVDPGFDSIKVDVNGYYLKFPNEIVDITNLDDARFVGKKNKSFMKVSYLEGKQHLVGAYAATYRQENKNDSADMMEEKGAMNDTLASFDTVDKEILIMTAIAQGLITYAMSSKDNIVTLKKRDDGIVEVNTGISKIYLGMALPHAIVDDAWSSLSGRLIGNHKFMLETADATYEINIDTNRTMPGSQVIAALYGVLTDDYGVQLEDEDGILNDKKLPSIVIDGGYKTMGIAHCNSDLLVGKAESSLDYSMGNIYDIVAKRISEKTGRQNVTASYIKQIMRKSDHMVHYHDEDGKGYSLDAESIVKEEVKRVCGELVDKLRKEYDNLDDIKSIVVTGGTGMAYYEHIKELLKDSDWIDVILTDYDYFGEAITPDYAIVIGMYKVLRRAADVKAKKKG